MAESSKKRTPGHSNDPFFWGLFSAGGVVAAFLLPVHLFLFGLAFPLGWLDPPAYYQLRTLVAHPLARLYMFVLCSLPLFHWAHRFRYFLFDLGLHGGRMLLAVLCYGLAVVGTIAAAIVLLRV